MPFEPTEPSPLGRTGLRVTRLGLGGASIGGLFEAVDGRRRDRDGRACLGARHPRLRRRAALRLRRGGAADGAGPAGRPRDDSSLSTKVGRLVRPRIAIPAGADVDRQALDGRDDAFYARAEPVRLVFDYSRRRRPPVDRGEPRAPRSRPRRHRADPRSRRSLGAGDRRGLAGARPAARRRASSAPSAPA